MPYIYAGVTAGTKSGRGWKRLYWWWARKLVGRGLFIHAYLGFEDGSGRQLIYHATAMGAHVTSRKTLLIGRRIYAEWRYLVDDETYQQFVTSCYDDAGLVPYGHLQNAMLGIIKTLNLVLPARFQIERNPFGRGRKEQNCSERAGTKAAKYLTAGGFLRKDPDMYGPDDFYDDNKLAELAGRAEPTIIPDTTSKL